MLRHPSWWLFGLLLLIAALPTACNRKSSAAGGALFGSGPIVVAESTPAAAALERQMHARLNRDRAKNGLPPLEFDAELADIARAHSKDMAERDFFAHDSPRTGSLQDRLDRAGRLCAVARENIGEGPDVDGTQDALLKSPGHYANIMARDVSHIGIGIVEIGSGATRRLLVTQVFAAPLEEQDPDDAREVAARRIAAARKAAGLSALPSHPKLEQLAKDHVDEVADDLDTSSTQRIGESVTKELQGTGLNGVIVGASVVLSADIYEPTGAPLRGEARAIGIAAARAKDERGRPAIKLLLLIGL